MRKIIILFSIVLLVISCNDTKKENFKIANSIRSEINPDLFSDSLFIGEPLAADAEFIRNVEAGGDNYRYFEQFGNVLKKHNKKYVNYKSNGFIKTLKVSDKLTLELKRKKYSSKDKNSDIQIVLFTKINDAVKDSIVFYKYQLDQDFPKEQRFETLAFLDNNLEIFKLESYSGLSEFAFQAEKWERFKINSSNGKIELIKKINYKDSANTTTDNKETNTEVSDVNAVSNEIFPFEDSAVKWKLTCENSNPQKYVYFEKHEANFVFSYSDGFSIVLIVRKINDKEYGLYYSYPPFFPAPEDMDFENYATTKPCATFNLINTSKIEFTWLGFYNNKTNKKERLKNSFTQKIETSPVILEKCSS